MNIKHTAQRLTPKAKGPFHSKEQETCRRAAPLPRKNNSCDEQLLVLAPLDQITPKEIPTERVKM
eukprot:scaffold16949_cov228-Skeletonema_dohrnii-CCMP3373.AAC.1